MVLWAFDSPEQRPVSPHDCTQDPSTQYPYKGLDHAKDTWHHSLDSRFVVLQDQSRVQSHHHQVTSSL